MKTTDHFKRTIQMFLEQRAAEDELFAKRYRYDENEIEVGKPIQCQVVVNHVVELTEEEKQEARRKAVAQYQQMELQKLQNRNKPTAKKETQVQPSLFDF